MDIASMLQQSGALSSVASELGIDQQTASVGAAALLPAILGGFKKQAQVQPSGLEGLIGMLGGMGGGGLLESVVGPQPTPVEQGNNILGTIFGSKDVSRQVADQASAQTGIGSDTLRKLLPIVAMLAAGYMASQSNQGQGGGLGGMLGSVLGGGQQAGGLGGLGGILGSVLGGGQQQAAPAGGLGGLASMLDMDRDGNPLDDIIGMAGRLRG